MARRATEAPPNRTADETGAQRSKADWVYLSVKRAILRGELPPGAAIDKVALCRDFGVSRLPVTTAINRLAYEGLVVIEPQRGSYVSPIRLDDVLQWMMTRRTVEGEVAAEAARRLPAKAHDLLARNLHYQEAAIAVSDYGGFLDLDIAFHRLLTEGLGLPRVADTLDSLGVHLDRVRRLLLPEPGRMAATLAEHHAIRSAIVSGRPAAADRAMRRHLMMVTNRLRAFESDHPDFFGS